MWSKYTATCIGSKSSRITNTFTFPLNHIATILNHLVTRQYQITAITVRRFSINSIFHKNATTYWFPQISKITAFKINRPIPTDD